MTEVELMKQIGLRIKKARKDKNINQQEVADAIGITNITFSKIENGTKDISVIELMRICDFLKIDFVSTIYGYDVIALDLNKVKGLL